MFSVRSFFTASARAHAAVCAFAAACAWCASGNARAAGFDCSQSVKAAEQTICTNEPLAAADRQQSALYRGLLDAVPADLRDNLRQSQREFLRKRDACQANVPCIQSEYLWRHHELCGVAKLMGRSCHDHGEQPR